jgi:hypothetical protein
MITNTLMANSLDNLRTIADGGVTQADAYARLRDDIPALFPEHPTMAEIKAVTDSDEWAEFDDTARLVFATAYFKTSREVGGKMVDMAQFNVSLWTADNKTAKSFDDTEKKIRKAAQAYVRIAIRQNVTKLIPEAVDAPKDDEKAETLPDPTATLALVTEALIVLSEKSPDGALALLNGLDNLVKVARPHVSARQPIPRKA